MGSRGPIKKTKTASVRTASGQRLRQLPGEADAIFRRLARDIDGLAPADVALLELLSYWIEIAKECRVQLAAPETAATSDDQLVGLVLAVTDTAHGNKEESRKNPILIVLRTATEQIRALTQQLGASPMARARLPEGDGEGQISFGEQFFQAAADALKAKTKADGIR